MRANLSRCKVSYRRIPGPGYTEIVFEVAKTPRDRIRDRMARVDWPDGPVCPFCGTREQMTPELDGTHVRVRYTCVQCGRHHGYIRRRMPDLDFPSTRRQVLPRDPDGR